MYKGKFAYLAAPGVPGASLLAESAMPPRSPAIPRVCGVAVGVRLTQLLKEKHTLAIHRGLHRKIQRRPPIFW